MVEQRVITRVKQKEKQAARSSQRLGEEARGRLEKQLEEARVGETGEKKEQV